MLEEAGSKVRIQAWDFQAGNNFVVEMHRAASDAERTLAVLSPDYEKSLFGIAEWAAALAQDPSGEKGKLLPVRVREMKPNGLLKAIVYIDLVGLDEPAAQERLLKGLARGRAKPAEKPAFPGSPRPRFPGEPIPPPDPEEARAQLRSLPEDEIPEPGPLPPGSHMPLSRNPLFVGRENELRTLARSLKAGETAAVGQIAAATGLGGIGKTQLASEFVHRYGRYFSGGVFWMNFANPAAVPGEVVSSGRGLDLQPDFDKLPVEQQIRLVKQAWHSPIPRLLVLDNCEDPVLFDNWRPRFGGSRVLVTSWRSQWDPVLGIQTLALGTLIPRESIDLLHRFRNDLSPDNPSLIEIAEELGHLPLALHLAGSFLARYRHAPFGQPTAYLEELRRGNLLDHPSLQGKGSEISPTDHERHVARTFALSYERLDQADSIDDRARAILARASYFAPGEPIPRSLLFAATRQSSEDFASDLNFEEAVGRAISLGLLLEARENGNLVMHRLVAVFLQQTDAIAGAQAREAVEEAVFTKARLLNEAGYPAPLLSWQSHLRTIADAARERGQPSAAALCNELGFHLLMTGDLSGARVYYEQALSIREKILGLEHPGTVVSINNMGYLLSLQGDLNESRVYLERALKIRQKILDPDHSDIAASLTNLGSVLDKLGYYDEARSCFERALAINEKTFGTDHPITVLSLNNIGRALSVQGNYPEARVYFERALSGSERILGPEHPHTATYLNNLGDALDAQGNYAGARIYYEQALTIREKMLGADHLDTAMSLNNLGVLLVKQKEYDKAKACLERALSIQEKTFGFEHPDTALSFNNLGYLLSSQGDHGGASIYYKRALDIREKVLGPGHVDTARSLRNLGGALILQGDYSKARGYFERALVILESRLGPAHLETQNLKIELDFIRYNLPSRNQRRSEKRKARPRGRAR